MSDTEPGAAPGTQMRRAEGEVLDAAEAIYAFLKGDDAGDDAGRQRPN